MEFIFSMIIVLLLVYALIRAFRWAGLDLAERRMAHDGNLIKDANENWKDTEREKGPLGQIQPDFYETKTINMIIPNW